MRYAPIRPREIVAEALRRVGDASEEARVAIEAYETSDAMGASDVESDGSVTFADVMTGAARAGRTGKERAYTACDIIAAVPVVRCEEAMEWVEDAREKRLRDARQTSTFAWTAPAKMRVVEPRLVGGRGETKKSVKFTTTRMQMMEVPTIEDEDETQKLIQSAIREASFATGSDSLFDLDDDALNALDCVENDLQKRYDIEREDVASRSGVSVADKLQDFISLFPRLRETSFMIDDPSPMENPLAFALSLAKKVETLPCEYEMSMDPSLKDHLKNLLFQGRANLPSIDPIFNIEHTKTTKQPVHDASRPALMEVMNPTVAEDDLNSVLKKLVVTVEDDHAPERGVNERMKEELTKKLLETPGDKFSLQPMVVPKIEQDDDARYRAERAMRDIIKSVQEVKEQAPSLDNWKVSFPNLMESLERSKAGVQEELSDIFKETMFADDDEDIDWDAIPNVYASKTTESKPKTQGTPPPPTFSESLSLSKLEKSNEPCSIDVVELDLDSQQTDLIQVLAQRYAYTAQILPLDIQAMIPKFQLGKSEKLSQVMIHFTNESSTITRHLKTLFRCQAIGTLVLNYGIHLAHTFMKTNAKDDQDLSDIKCLIEQKDNSVMRREFDDHPKLRNMKMYLAQRIVTGGKMLVIFPDTVGIFAIRQFITRMNTSVAQFDGKQEFKSLCNEDVEEFSRAAQKSAMNTEVVIALEAHVAHAAFPLELFSTCVYYAPSAETVRCIQEVGSSRHAANNFVYVLKMKHDDRWSANLDPTSSSLHVQRSPEVVNVTRDTSAVYDNEPNLSPRTENNGVFRHVVVLNVARQIVKARESLFAEAEQALLNEGCEIVLREFGIDVDACSTVGNRVHGVIMIVPEYFAEGLPSQLELLSLTEDLVLALAESFSSGTIIFEGDSDFLRIAQSLHRRLCSDAMQMNIIIDCQYCFGDEVLSTLIDVLAPQVENFSDFSALIPEQPSMEEVKLCELFPRLNPISACALLANDIACDSLRATGKFTHDVITRIQNMGGIGCPLTVLMSDRRERQAALSSPVYSPRELSPPQHLHEGYAARPMTQFLSPEAKRRQFDDFEFDSISLDSPPHATPRPRSSTVRHMIDIPSPIVDLQTSPTTAPRSLFPSPQHVASPQSKIPPTLNAVGRLWKPMRHSDEPSSSTGTRLDRNRRSTEFPAMLESYRMPPPPEQRRKLDRQVPDVQRNLMEHRFKRISSTKTQRLPETWR